MYQYHELPCPRGLHCFSVATTACTAQEQRVPAYEAPDAPAEPLSSESDQGDSRGDARLSSEAEGFLRDELEEQRRHRTQELVDSMWMSLE